MTPSRTRLAGSLPDRIRRRAERVFGVDLSAVHVECDRTSRRTLEQLGTPACVVDGRILLRPGVTAVPPAVRLGPVSVIHTGLVPAARAAYPLAPAPPLFARTSPYVRARPLRRGQHPGPA